MMAGAAMRGQSEATLCTCDRFARWEVERTRWPVRTPEQRRRGASSYPHRLGIISGTSKILSRGAHQRLSRAQAVPGVVRLSGRPVGCSEALGHSDQAVGRGVGVDDLVQMLARQLLD